MPTNESLKALAFDTSSNRGSVALLEGGRLRADLRVDASAAHSEHLLQSVDFLLGRAGWRLRDLGLVASGLGPGSFTGVRIGVATALGLAQSLGIPFAGVSGLDVLARRLASAAAVPAGVPLAVLLDAHRNQVYFGGYESRGGGGVRQAGKPALVDLPELGGRLAGVGFATGDLDGRLLTALAAARPGMRWVAVDLFLAEGVGRLALERRRTWRAGEALLAEPLYVRPPDAVKNARKAARKRQGA
ncbi:MAG: tRNA (adenosine(37)-N6)-threonylcarbamoyltransferase complex dimerization subunit type 1 TsaB [Acidobacteriota bacterium]|jgi:tRNA threonylcarbamoyladenosine biosynthesis protein TsaB|nr:tRNA (adenosine(37)-N6)-threonylcarbamoyltransferase complex dimerization subunit type 1 TsaB [Acidobacteriota bacterium]